MDIREVLKSCSSGYHTVSKSGFPFDQVPGKYFLKYPDKKYSTEMFLQCSFCREYAIQKNNQNKVEREEAVKASIASNEKFRECGGQRHHCYSDYPKTAVPIEYLMKNKNDITKGFFKTCSFCRNRGIQENGKDSDRRNSNSAIQGTTYDDKIEYRECSNMKHDRPILNNKYPKSKVPASHFLKKPDDPNSGYFKSCINCREYVRKPSKNKAEKREEILEKDDSPEFLPCISRNHTASKSDYDHMRVPYQNFIDPNDPEGPLKEICCDCTIYATNVDKERKEKNIEEAIKQGKCSCSRCHKIFDKEEMGTHKNGRMLATCISCTDKMKIERKENNDLMKKLKLEKMLEHECCCERCNNIFLSPVNDSIVITEIETFTKNGDKYLIYKGKETKVKDFLKENSDILAYEILEYDHLSESELRERKMLKDDEIYPGKRDSVYELKGEDNKRKEILICQLLCSRCHVIVTIERENKNASRKHFGKDLLAKKEFVDNLKRLMGCSECGYKNDNLLRFFEMDHINPPDKIACICEMIYQYKYTMEDLIKEIEKCRILCKFCHVIHTHRQRNQGLLVN